MKRVVIIGSGNLAYSLAKTLSDKNTPPVQIFARNREQGSAIASICGCPYADEPSELAQADLYVISVSDRAIKQVAAGLDFGDAVVAHTAASVGTDVFPDNVKSGAVLYPLQTFTKGREIDISDVPFFIEASDENTLAFIRDFASSLSSRIYESDAQTRARVHAAAIFAGNFTNHMYTIGELLAREAGYDFSLLKPLIRETAAKAIDADSPLETQTGPAIRNDFHTKSLHCELLQEKADLKNIYINLSNNIWETSKKISQK